MSGARVRRVLRLMPLAAAALALALAAAGCATKGYVNKELQQIEERVGRVETTANDATAQSLQAHDLAVQNGDKAKQALIQAELAKDMALGNVRREVVRTEAIYFGFDSAELSEEAKADLADIAQELQTNPNYMVLLMGYADPSGDEHYNLQLAERRAAAVRHHLAQLLGADFVRIASIGFGELVPDVEGAYRECRRVDAQIVRPMPPAEGSHTATGATD